MHGLPQKFSQEVITTFQNKKVCPSRLSVARFTIKVEKNLTDSSKDRPLIIKKNQNWAVAYRSESG